MTGSRFDPSTSPRAGVRFAELLKVGEMFSYRQSKKITGIFSGGDDNDT